jgi:hypothetical protein
MEGVIEALYRDFLNVRLNDVAWRDQVNVVRDWVASA